MKRILSNTYYIIWGIAVVLMLVGLKWGKTETFSRGNVIQETEIKPYMQEAPADDTRVYYFTVESADGVSMTLEFFTNRKEVVAFADDKLIYAFQTPDSIFGSNPGSKFHFVEIPVETKQVKVVISTLHKKAGSGTTTFYLGDGIDLYRKHIETSLLDILISLTGILIGVFLVAYWLFVKKKKNTERSALYFGFFAMILGTWTLHETDFATIIVQNRTAASFCGYILMMLMVIPFVLFTKNFMKVEDKYIAHVICGFTAAVMVINTAGHMMQLWCFYETAPVIHLCIGMGLAYLIYAIWYRMKYYGVDNRVKANILGSVVLVAAVGIDLASYYLETLSADIMGRLGLLIYIILLSRENLLEFFRQLEIGRKAELYKELATHDMMTGLYNRNAFDNWEKHCKHLEQVTLVTFDLNNLKKCNDLMGHELGDKYIIDASNYIQEIFGKIAKCYRIGGDEFCAVIEKGNSIDIKAYLSRLYKLQEVYNARSEDITMQIACGYATYQESDLNLAGTRSRADARMYIHKKELKETTKNN